MTTRKNTIKGNHVVKQSEQMRVCAEAESNSMCCIKYCIKYCIQLAARASESTSTDAAPSKAAKAPGTRERSHQNAQNATRRLKYHAGSFVSARRCHLSSWAQVPCSSSLYSSFSVGTTGVNREWVSPIDPIWTRAQGREREKKERIGEGE
jgi:hypothetical protein